MPTPMKDYYKILQVDPSAEQEVIEGAYRRLAAKYHPDKNMSLDATTRMQEINEAYDTLHDPDRRVAYDLERPAHDERARVDQEKAERERRAKAERDEYEHLLKEQKERRAEAERKREEQEKAERERRNKAAVDAEFEMWLRENPNSRAEYEHRRRGQVEAQGQRDEFEGQQSESSESIEAVQRRAEFERPQQIEAERPAAEIRPQPNGQPEAKKYRSGRWRTSPIRVFLLALVLWLTVTMVAKEVSLSDEVYVSMVCLSGLVLLYFASVVSAYWLYWLKR